MSPRDAYDELIERSKEAALVQSCAELLAWEEQTYMPPGGVEHRGNQLAVLAGIAHEKITDPRIGELLSLVEDSDLVTDAASAEAVNVRELRRRFDRKTRLPTSLVQELAKTTTLAQRHWTDARKRSDYAAFQPWLGKVVALKQQEAEAIGFQDDLYDALLDDYEPGAKTGDLRTLFEELRTDLVPLVSAIADAPAQPNVEILKREYPVDLQKVFAETAAATIGFDFERGRLDVTTHPFCCGIGPGDCRITTRYNPRFFNEAFFGVLHEAGHGLYEQGLEAEHHGTPLGEAVSLGVHESQSRMWENAVGRGLPFWEYFFPIAQRIFRSALGGVGLDDFYFAVNSVQPSFIRVEADEVTYNLHVLIRFELEQALLGGDLPIGELPGVWNEKYTQYLGVTPTSDAVGCLQDVHWSSGLFGYFPTYTLGNVYAAQFFATAGEEIDGLARRFSRGDFHDLLDWLRERIHRQGMRYRSRQLVEKVTGSPPDHQPLVAGLRNKFGRLYGLKG